MTRRKERRLRIAQNAYRRKLQRVIGRAERVPPRPRPRRKRTLLEVLAEVRAALGPELCAAMGDR